MSQENVETLRQAADALARDGLDGFAEFWTYGLTSRGRAQVKVEFG